MNTTSTDNDPDALRAWFDLAPDAMLAVDHTGCIVLANEQAGQMFGYPPSDLQRLSLATVIPEPPGDEHAIDQDRGARAGGIRATATNHEVTGLKHDGRPFPVELRLHPLAAKDGTLTLISVRDISESPRVQRALARARYDNFRAQISTLALESTDYEAAIQRIPELLAEALGVPAVAILSADWHRNTFRIRAAKGLTDLTAETLTAVFGDGELIHRAFEASGHAAITSDEPRGGVAAAICAGLEPTRYRHFALVPLFGRYEPLGVLIALMDREATCDADKLNLLRSIANLLTATAQRSHAEEQLAHAQRLDAVGQLTGGVAHDFNNLLTVVSGNLQLLEAGLGDRGEAREAIDAALRAVDRGAELTRKLLTFARRQSLKPAAVKPEPTLRDLEYMLRRTLGEAITVQIECAPDTPAAYADPAELETALVNLALNARDAMPRGGRLTLVAKATMIDAGDDDRASPPGRYVAFSVADTGTGMARDVQARACEPFFTTKGAGKGSGLGLSMVYGFVMQSGGHLTVDSRLGYGTRVEFLLPVAEDAGAASARDAAVEADLPERSGTVLVVEDEPEVRRVAAAFLRKEGYEVLTAGSAPEALEQLAANPQIDLLFSDVVLGGPMGGAELAREARRSHPELAVLLASGYAGAVAGTSPTDATAAFPLLRKPYRREQLQRAVRAALEDR